MSNRNYADAVRYNSSAARSNRSAARQTNIQNIRSGNIQALRNQNNPPPPPPVGQQQNLPILNNNQNNFVPPPPPPPPQGQNNVEDFSNRINALLGRLTAFKDPLIQFIRETEPQFIRTLLQKIQDIQRILADSNNDVEITRRINILRQRSNTAQEEINRLNNTLTESQQQQNLANEAVARLQNENQQARDHATVLENARAELLRQNELNANILRDLPNALRTLESIITELEGLTTQRNNNDQLRQQLSSGLDELGRLVNIKLEAYQNMMGQLPQEGGIRSKDRKRTKKNRGKKMSGGYSYPSAGYEGAQEIVIAPSRSARSRSRRSSSARRQSRRRPKII